MNHYLPKLILLFTLLFCCRNISAQQLLPADSVRYRYGLQPIAETQTKTSAENWLVIFKKTVSPQRLEAYGLRKIINAKAFIVHQQIPENELTKQLAYQGPANFNWKASEVLLQQLEKSADTDSITVRVSIKQDLPAVPYITVISIRRDYNIAMVKLPVKQWSSFIADTLIVFADKPRKALTEMILNGANPYINRINIAQEKFPGIDGKSIAVSVKEDKFDTTDLDFAGRIIYNPDASTNVTSHATTMATIIAGAGNTGALGLGAAPAAGLSSSNFNITLLPDTATYYRKYNISLQNHSYGTEIENFYGPDAAAYDKQIYESDTLEHVFSAGNIGGQPSNSGIYQGLIYANLTGNVKQAKNLLVVGGTDAAGNFISLSSHGPAYDGRIKPELSAFGQDGTSGAAATVTGISTLLQDYWKQQTFTPMPSALLKVILLNSAGRATGTGPNYKSGYGSVNALHALQTLKDKHFGNGSTTGNNSTSIDLNIPDNIQELKVTLYWNDLPASVNATKALVNDLDLRVTGTDGNLYLPWILNPAPDSLAVPAKRGRDTLNNIEQVTITNPAAGTARIHISAGQLRGTQTWYYAYELVPKSTFAWHNPDAQTIFEANTNVDLYWESTYTGNGNVQYSLDSGATWQTVVTNYPVSSGYLGWYVPATFSKAMLRFQLPDTSFTSPPFIISPKVTIQTGFNCADSTFIFWDNLPNAVQYNIYNMGKTRLQPYQQTADTFLFIAKAQLSSSNFAVSPVSAAGWEGLRSYTVDFTTQGVDCYVKSLIADKTTDNAVQLTLNLGSTYQLKEVVWQRYNGKSWDNLQTTPITGSLLYYYTDPNTWEGLMYYRVQLNTFDGRAFYSGISTVQIFKTDNIMVFPNPVVNTLGIMDPVVRERQVVITDMSGRERMRVTITDSLAGIGMSQLPAGVYNCTIYYNGQRIYNRKFVKL
ncbi:Por secretion system C-terminal sorting domain-containing protein [Chitinophaga jiangningensis]|uniref:Por secretion system C-terminal sorting domain-containing protein n=1 Tax=Chitinophaga jiangningensis TaxID=1419482 RepID=A0A1M6YPN0_9BACT|nr:S8 family peptidase [Chitinophaga jiangningensis]SHL20053.1 Por secretion system C-terminal sorting domain-containing protein [Chitinophaga jiangningensis]